MKFFKLILIIASGFSFALIFYYFFPEKKLDSTKKIDKLVVLKSERELQALSEGRILKKYTIALGRQPIGAKQFEGDNKTPEGLYFIESKNPNSDYFMNLGISYPSKSDIEFAEKSGKKAGGLIKIHGLKNGMGYIGKFHRWFDWTRGCIALTNQEVKELYDNVPIGTPIEIKP